MTADNATVTPVLDGHYAEFITRNVSIMVASCSAEGVPSLARACGCRVSSDRRNVTVFLSVPRSASLLRDLRVGGGIATVFTRPTTHETIQLKSTAGEIAALQEGDRAIMQSYAASFISEIFQIGYRDPFASAMTAAIADDCVAVAFRPTAAFLQTPGPSAGTRLGARA